jgi:hypothetical protein
MLSAMARGVSKDSPGCASPSGANRFAIDSNFGVFEADGNEVLVGESTRSTLLPSLSTCPAPISTKKALIAAAKSLSFAGYSYHLEPSLRCFIGAMPWARTTSASQL